MKFFGAWLHDQDRKELVFNLHLLNQQVTVECHELGQKIRILGQGQDQDSSVD